MISARTVWRVIVVPLYVVLAGAIFAAAMARTAGSIIGGLAALAPWAFIFAAALALMLALGGMLRIRRRLRCMRRSLRRQHARHAARRGADAWDEPGSTWDTGR